MSLPFPSLFPSRSGWCHKLNFLALWLCYKSLFDVGQTFLWFQWDILLLETGFLCLIVAPLTTFQNFGMFAKRTTIVNGLLLCIFFYSFQA